VQYQAFVTESLSYKQGFFVQNSLSLILWKSL